MRPAIAAALIVLACMMAACGQSSTPKFQLTDVTGANFGKALALHDHTGKLRTLADFQGKVVVIFFGYTQCPDVCPTTLSEMTKVVKELGADGSKVQVLFVSVDPERDTREMLSQYVAAFHPSFLGMAGDADATARTAKEFKVYVQKQPARNGGYTIDHSAGTFILDQQGRLRLFAPYGAGAPALLADIRMLLKQTS
jgi:protein SCO1/2